MTLHCLKSARCFSGNDAAVSSFLDSAAAVLRRSLCAVDWNVRDTSVEFINGVFLAGKSCRVASLHSNTDVFITESCLIFFFSIISISIIDQACHDSLQMPAWISASLPGQ